MIDFSKAKIVTDREIVNSDPHFRVSMKSRFTSGFYIEVVKMYPLVADNSFEAFDKFTKIKNVYDYYLSKKTIEKPPKENVGAFLDPSGDYLFWYDGIYFSGEPLRFSYM